MLNFIALLSVQQLTSWLRLLPDLMGLCLVFFFLKLAMEGEDEF